MDGYRKLNIQPQQRMQDSICEDKEPCIPAPPCLTVIQFEEIKSAINTLECLTKDITQRLSPIMYHDRPSNGVVFEDRTGKEFPEFNEALARIHENLVRVCANLEDIQQNLTI